jgi:DNA polymerase-3 subunit alpha
MGKKIKAEMDAQRQNFVEGAEKNGVKKDKASSIFDQVDKFAGYGFNKSHAAAYALVCYQTAYLKANHPVEFFAATMTLDMGNVRQAERLPARPREDRCGVAAARRHPVDGRVHRRGHAEGKKAIRYALAAIKGVGRDAMAELAASARATARSRTCSTSPSGSTSGC